MSLKSRVRPVRAGLVTVLSAGLVLGASPVGPGAVGVANAQTAPSPTPTAQPTLAAGVTQEVVFNDPTVNATTKQDYRIHDRLVKLIDGVPAGGALRGAIYSISTTSVSNALLRAHARGVTVNLVIGGQTDITTGEPARLKQALGEQLVHCKATSPTGQYIHACVSNRGASTMHSKFFTFSSSGTKKNLVAVTSTNWSGAQAAQYNDMVIISGDAATYQGYTNYFWDLSAMRRNNDYASTPRGTVASTGALAVSRFSPKAASNGSTAEEASTDLVAQSLALLSSGAPCSVRASQRYIDERRDPIADQLVRLRRGGCTVQVLYNSIPKVTLDRLRGEGVQMRRVHVYHPELGFETKIHHKYYVVKGNYAGTPDSGYVFTGSHNWTGSAVRSNDEILLRLGHAPVVSAYDKNFTTIWDRSA